MRTLQTKRLESVVDYFAPMKYPPLQYRVQVPCGCPICVCLGAIGMPSTHSKYLQISELLGDLEQRVHRTTELIIHDRFERDY